MTFARILDDAVRREQEASTIFKLLLDCSGRGPNRQSTSDDDYEDEKASGSEASAGAEESQKRRLIHVNDLDVSPVPQGIQESLGVDSVESKHPAAPANRNLTVEERPLIVLNRVFSKACSITADGTTRREQIRRANIGPNAAGYNAFLVLRHKGFWIQSPAIMAIP